MKTFDDWFYEYEDFSTRADRMHAMIGRNSAEYTIVKIWLEAAYNQGREDERNKSTTSDIPHSKYYYDFDRNQ